MINQALAELQDLDRRHHVHPFTNTREINATGSRMIARAEGCYLWTVDGHKLLDGMAGLWCVNVGYGRQELADVAASQMHELPYYNSFFQCTTPITAQLSAKLAAVAPPSLSHVMFCNSGSEANDTNYKLVHYYWNLMGRPAKKVIIAREFAYHGVTAAAASLSGLTPMHTEFDLPLPDIARIPTPYWFQQGGDEEPELYGRRMAALLERKILDLGPERVGAFIGEPVQGAGGLIVPPASYWPEIERICRKYDVLLIADEVICGFGRTGSWFGCQTLGFTPDLITMAKGLSSGYLPIAGVLIGDRIMSAILEKGGELAHGYTYSGHPVACAVAKANIEIIEREGLVGRVRDRIGPYFQAKLRTLLNHPLVGEVRGIGLLGGVELTPDKATRAQFKPEGRVGMTTRNHCTAEGLVCRAVRDVMVLSPPLIVSEAEVDEAVDKLRRALDRTLAVLPTLKFDA